MDQTDFRLTNNVGDLVERPMHSLRNETYSIFSYESFYANLYFIGHEEKVCLKIK